MPTPPIAKQQLLSVTASGRDEKQVLRCALALRDAFQTEVGSREDVRILGPAPLNVVRVMDNFRYRVTLCVPPQSGLRPLVAQAVTVFSTDKDFREVSVFADNDPSD